MEMPRRSLQCLLLLIEDRNQARLRAMRAQQELAHARQEAFNADSERMRAENALNKYMQDADPPLDRCQFSGCRVRVRRGTKYCLMHSINITRGNRG
jgi:hypothetical protein